MWSSVDEFKSAWRRNLKFNNRILALGKPVIATRRGATDEVAMDNQNGYLINPHNSSELVNCIQTLKSDKKLREQFGAKSAEIAQTTFDLKIMTEKYAKMYQQVLQTETNK